MSKQFSNLVVNRDGTFFVKSRYNKEEDLVLVIGRGGGNGLPDIRRAYTVKNCGELNDDLTFYRSVLEHETDLIGPSITRSAEKGDGDNPESRFFTGGNHQTNNKGTGGGTTARCIAFECTYNGDAVQDVSCCESVDFRWTNLICGYNTSRIDGGREIIREDVHMCVSGGKATVRITQTALEDIIRETYYGFQMVTPDYPSIYYVDGKDPGPHPPRIMSTCGDKFCRKIRLERDTVDTIEIGVEPMGLGNFELNKEEFSAFNRHYAKCYFNLIQNNEYLQKKGESVFAEGYFHFYSK